MVLRKPVKPLAVKHGAACQLSLMLNLYLAGLVKASPNFVGRWEQLILQPQKDERSTVDISSRGQLSSIELNLVFAQLA
jgi:hypothetical protein